MSGERKEVTETFTWENKNFASSKSEAYDTGSNAARKRTGYFVKKTFSAAVLNKEGHQQRTSTLPV